MSFIVDGVLLFTNTGVSKITPEVRDFTRRQIIVRKLEAEVAPEIFASKFVYDGQKLLYVSSELKLPGTTSGIFTVPMGTPRAPSAASLTPGTRGTFQVQITKTQSRLIRPSDALHLLNQKDPQSQSELSTITNVIQLLIKQAPNEANPNNARAYFIDGDKRVVRQSGLELWRGYFQSVRPTIDRLVINVDTTMAAVYKTGSLVDVAVDYLGLSNMRQLDLPPASPQFKMLERFLKKVQITTRTTGRTKVIRALQPNAGMYEFTKQDGITQTVADYCQHTYNLTTYCKKIVGVNLSGLKSERPEILPLEMCIVKPNQLFKRKLPENVTAEAVRFANLQPPERLGLITAQDGPLSHKYTSSEWIVESGMRIDTTPVTIAGRLLEAPTVILQQPVDLNKGSWNVVRQRLNAPAALNSWAIVSFVDGIRDDEIVRKMKDLANCCVNLGMNVQPPLAIHHGHGNNAEQVKDVLDGIVANFGDRLAELIIVIILPQSAAALRAQVKHWSDIRQGVRTQCIREQNFKLKANNQYWNNVALKLNARLGGINFIVQSPAMNYFRREPSMIMGADVGHPAPGIQRPSISSLVWSVNPEATKYRSTTRIQIPRLEYIADLQDMVQTAIQDFLKVHNGRGPSRIYFFRDGVSEGEFNTVAIQEIEAIEAVWKARKISNPPKLTYVIVGKRHHLAFFPQGSSTMNDGKGNCKPGFVVDKELSNPFPDVDFYLQSHAAIIGTSRSSRYTLIKDDNQIGAEGLQQLAFSLCHVYAKATRSVSIPAPVYYADLACQRMAFHLPPNSDLNVSDSASVASGATTFDLDAWKREFGEVNNRVKQSMYFL
ncbi:hypothetical protein PQX77_005063 [Marasmius sp. AFHP31]|nr:hypothetical protein PQX77_005063 [Marasmius sp. AFHP31]